MKFVDLRLSVLATNNKLVVEKARRVHSGSCTLLSGDLSVNTETQRLPLTSCGLTVSTERRSIYTGCFTFLYEQSSKLCVRPGAETKASHIKFLRL